MVVHSQAQIVRLGLYNAIEKRAATRPRAPIAILLGEIVKAEFLEEDDPVVPEEPEPVEVADATVSEGVAEAAG